MIQQWDFPVDEPVSLPECRHHRLHHHLPAIVERKCADTSIRALADEYGVSREAIRRAVARSGIATEVEKEPQPGLPLRRVRAYRLPGRGHSRAFTPAEVTELLRRHGSGESVRALARATGVSYET